MKFPLTKIQKLAAAPELDPVELFNVALRESDPALSEVVEQAYNPLHLTSSETNLIKHLRELSGDTPGGSIVFPGKVVIALVAVGA